MKILKFIQLLLLLVLIVGTFQKSALAQSPQAPAASAESLLEGNFISRMFSVKAFTDYHPVQKRIWQTVFIILIGYILMFTLISFVNRGVRDMKARHIIRKNIIYFVSFSINR